MRAPALFYHVGKQAEKPRALDRAGQLALLFGRHGGDAARHDLAAFGDEALQEASVFVVDLGRVRAREWARFAAAEKWAARRHPRAAAGTGALAFHLRLHPFFARPLLARPVLAGPVLARTVVIGPVLAVPVAVAAARTVFAAAAVLHHRGRVFVELVDPHGQVAQHVLVDPHRALELGDRRRGRVDVEEHVVALAVFVHAVGEISEAPIFALLDLAPLIRDQLGKLVGERFGLGAGDIL